MLTTAQKATLKTDAQSVPALSGFIAVADWPAVANYYNTAASPAFTVWKSLVSLSAVGMAFDFSAVSGLTTADSTRLQLMFQVSPQGINPYLADRRAAFDSIFSAVSGATTRASLMALWKRLATNAEKLFATGTGSDASPATLVFEGAVSATEVQSAFGQ